jgi:hypothetical protein
VQNQRQLKGEGTVVIYPPRHIVLSTNGVDLSDPFQRKWYIRQIVSSQKVGANPCGRLAGQAQGLPLPQVIEKIRQILLHGRAEDIRVLDLEEVAALLDDLSLPPDLYWLWKTFLETRSHAQE